MTEAGMELNEKTIKRNILGQTGAGETGETVVFPSNYLSSGTLNKLFYPGSSSKPF